ncbi:hypothetical protein BH11MYX3_BH11MYX3_09210 [soil metagenome]
MRIRSSILVVTVAVTAAACGGARAGRIMADTPALPYQAPDSDEIAGIDPDAEPAPAEAPAPASTPAQNPQR